MKSISHEEMFDLVYHVCFSANFFRGKTQAVKEDLILQACRCGNLYLAYLQSTLNAANRAIEAFGTKLITRRCHQIINYEPKDIENHRVVMLALDLITGLYASPALHRPFFDHRMHIIIIQSCWRAMKEGTEALQATLPLFVVHMFKYVLPSASIEFCEG